LVVMREFRQSDWRFLKDLASPGKMGRYMADELRGRRQG